MSTNTIERRCCLSLPPCTIERALRHTIPPWRCALCPAPPVTAAIALTHVAAEHAERVVDDVRVVNEAIDAKKDLMTVVTRELERQEGGALAGAGSASGYEGGTASVMGPPYSRSQFARWLEHHLRSV